MHRPMAMHSSSAAAQPAFTEFRKETTSWTIREDAVSALPGNLLSLLQHPEQLPGLTLLRENNVRASFFLTLPPAGELFIKRYKLRGLADIIKNSLLPSKAASEWRTLRRCADSGLPVPRPVAMAEKRNGLALEDSCVIVEALTDALPLNEFFTRRMPALTPADARDMRATLATHLAQLVWAVHRRKIFYRDLHAGNILLRTAADGAFRLFLIDLHRALFPPLLMQWMKVKDLAQLCNSLPGNAVDRELFLREYCREAAYHETACRKLGTYVAAAARRLEAQRLRSRSRRCMKNSTTFEVYSGMREQYCGRRDFGREAGRIAIAGHRAAVQRNQGQVLKQSETSVITFHDKKSGLPVGTCVKQYHYRGIKYAVKSLFTRTRARKSWIAGNAFLVRNVGTPLPLALFERKCGPFVVESFLLTEWLAGARELNDYITRLHQQAVPPPVKHSFITSLAEAVRDLHEKGVYHADLKSTNILVQEHTAEAWRFSFVDLDRVTFRDSLPFHERANNLAQINASISRLISAKERLKFFFIYAKGTELYRERKKYYREILTISRRKNTEPFGVTFR
jgi:tRNA A-37 threonylcarbamoyl transferase component Bud32